MSTAPASAKLPPMKSTGLGTITAADLAKQIADTSIPLETKRDTLLKELKIPGCTPAELSAAIIPEWTKMIEELKRQTIDQISDIDNEILQEANNISISRENLKKIKKAGNDPASEQSTLVNATTLHAAALSVKLDEKDAQQALNENKVALYANLYGSGKPKGTTTSYTPTKPNLGGLETTYYGEEAYVGGKPLFDWSGLETTLVPRKVLPTHYRSNNSKAAIAQGKRTEGLFMSDEFKFKSNDDLDDFFERLLKHFVKHGLDTITYRDVGTMMTGATGAAVVNDMKSLLAFYPLFNIKDIKKVNEVTYKIKYDEFDIQNDVEAIECLNNSIHEDLRKRLRVKIEPDMMFTEVLPLLVDMERPQSSELYDSYERRITKMDVSKFPGANIKDMAEYAREIINTMSKADAWDSKTNITLARIFTEAGGTNNEEYAIPMHQLLADVKMHEGNTRHLNNREKIKHMSKENVGWNEILKLAEDLYTGMTVEDNIRLSLIHI